MTLITITIQAATAAEAVFELHKLSELYSPQAPAAIAIAQTQPEQPNVDPQPETQKGAAEPAPKRTRRASTSTAAPSSDTSSGSAASAGNSAETQTQPDAATTPPSDPTKGEVTIETLRAFLSPHMRDPSDGPRVRELIIKHGGVEDGKSKLSATPAANLAALLAEAQEVFK